MRSILTAAAALTLGLVFAGDVLAQCPQSAANQGSNLIAGRQGGGMGSARGSSSAARGGLFSSLRFELSGGMGGFGAAGMMGGSGQQAQGTSRKRSRRGEHVAQRRAPEQRRRPVTVGKIAPSDERALQFVKSAAAAEARGDLRVAFAYYRLASRTGDNFEADRATLELERLKTKMSN